MLFQQILTAMVVFGAVGYIGRLVYLAFRADKGCEGACKCTPVKQADPR